MLRRARGLEGGRAGEDGRGGGIWGFKSRNIFRSRLIGATEELVFTSPNPGRCGPPHQEVATRGLDGRF
eukprot:SAG11_NODE_36108_length_263_cov_0.743902_1_plen_68_part_01